MMTIALTLSVPVSAATNNDSEKVIEVEETSEQASTETSTKSNATPADGEEMIIAEEDNEPIGYYDPNRVYNYWIYPYIDELRNNPESRFIDFGESYAEIAQITEGQNVVYPATVTCESEKDLVYENDKSKELIGQEIPVRVINELGMYFIPESGEDMEDAPARYKSVIIPDGVKHIYGAWYGSWDRYNVPDEYKYELEVLSIPDSIEHVNWPFMFWYCSVCPNHEVIIPASLKSVGNRTSFKAHEYPTISGVSADTYARYSRLKIVNRSTMTFTHEQLYENMNISGNLKESIYNVWYNENGTQVDELLPGETIYFGNWTAEGIYPPSTTDDFDRWGFENTEANYGDPVNGYAINTSDYQKLVSGLDPVRRDTVKQQLNVNLAGTNKKWFGSCYGMSASTIAVNTKDISTAGLGLGSAKTLMEVKTADSSYKNNKKDTIGTTESVINFFHAQQSLPEYQDVRYEFTKLTSAEQLSRVENLAKTAKSKPALIDIWWKEGSNIEGHSIVAKGWRKLGSTDSSALRNKYKYCIITYDSSNPDLTGNTSDCNIYYNDEGQWEVPGWGITPSNAYMICGSNDIATFNPVSYATGEYRKTATSQTSIKAAASEWTVNWGNNNHADIVNGVIAQSTDDSLRILPEATDMPLNDTVYRLTVPNNEVYTISSDKPINHSVATNDSITEIKTEGGAAVTYDNGNVSIKAKHEGVELRLVKNESPIASPEFKVNSPSSSELSIKKDEKGYLIKGNDLSDIELVEEKNGRKVKEFVSTDSKTIIVGENEKGETTVFADTDDDGIFETEVKPEKKASTIVIGQKLNVRQSCFADVTDTISRFEVSDRALASMSKDMLNGKKPGTVTVYAQKMISKNNYENLAECEVTILSKPQLKFTKNMTYVGQSINGNDFFKTDDIKTYGATYWESNKPGIIEVTDSSKGSLQAKGNGTAKITAYFGEKGVPGTYKVSANLVVKVPAFAKSDYNLQTGQKLTISMKNVTGALDPAWTAEKDNLATATAQLNNKGVKTGKVIVEALNYGDTKLIATIDGQAYECTVHVTAPEINKKAMTLSVGKTGTVSIKKTKIKKTDIKWETDNPEVAVVDINGKITAKKSGSAVIYTETGGIRNECHVTVQ